VGRCHQAHGCEDRLRMPAIKTRFLSHGTLGSKNLDATRRFYEEFLGLEVVRTSPVSLMVRLGGQHVYAVVYTKKKDRMPRIYHNGLDVESDTEVDEAWQSCNREAEKWGLHDITKPIARHGTYSFLFWDADDNAWEILSNPKGGYTWIFEQGDLSGRGHFDREFLEHRPGRKGRGE
jgi:catechol 2,3-dioxygenase-like lactoylglutathione lyase family enzyme